MTCVPCTCAQLLKAIMIVEDEIWKTFRKVYVGVRCCLNTNHGALAQDRSLCNA